MILAMMTIPNTNTTGNTIATAMMTLIGRFGAGVTVFWPSGGSAVVEGTSTVGTRKGLPMRRTFRTVPNWPLFRGWRVGTSS